MNRTDGGKAKWAAGARNCHWAKVLCYFNSYFYVNMLKIFGRWGKKHALCVRLDKIGSSLPECPLFSTVMLIVSVWPMKLKGDRAMSMWTLLVTMLIGDWRNPPHLGNWVAQWLGSKRHKQEKQQHHQILGFTDQSAASQRVHEDCLPHPCWLKRQDACLFM